MRLLLLALAISAYGQVSSQITLTLGTTPGNPASGKIRLWANTSTGNLECLKSTGASCLSSGGTPGGSTTQLQYNNAGAFGGITGATSDGTTVTLASPNLTTPHVTTILDGNGNPFITTSATGSAVNSITITNSTIGLVKIAGSGTDTDIVLQLAPKGEADVQFPMTFKTVKLNSLGDFNADAYTSDSGFSLDNNGLSLGGSRRLFWGASNWFDTPDTGLSRLSAGVLGAGTGAAGSHAGTLQAATIIIDNSSFTFNGHTCTIVANVVTCP